MTPEERIDPRYGVELSLLDLIEEDADEQPEG
jgi:hypothetical protein